ncbi:hypothetical protein CHARACLAT_024765 [Characodon lateralis]|uniref:Uncharacterized protein n=1 Tax=Characodon lateralis TaxID=208331 RepID=A0ABU7EPN8_9TELE|nr:hypothetical protein [Characodon lateralis]
MEGQRKFNMEDSPTPPRTITPLWLLQSTAGPHSSSAIISQGITFKDPLLGKHRSSAVLQPSSTPSPSWATITCLTGKQPLGLNAPSPSSGGSFHLPIGIPVPVSLLTSLLCK